MSIGRTFCGIYSHGRILIALLALGASIWFFTAHDDQGPTSRLTADAWYYHSYLPSLVLDGDLDFRNQYEITQNWYGLGETESGRQANVFGIGPAVYELPLFLTGHAIARVTGDANGFSRPEVAASLFASLLFSLGALYFAVRILRRRIGGRFGPVAITLLAASGGPLLYYAIRQPGYAHPFATFWVAWLVDHWDASYDGSNAPRSRRFWLGFGALLGAAALARPQLATWGLLGIFGVVSDARRARAVDAPLSPTAVNGALAAGMSLLVFSPQLLAWKALHGSFLPSPQGEGFMWWSEPEILSSLFSSRNGLFPWSPLYALATLGLLWGFTGRHRRIALALFLGVFLQAYCNGAAWDWWGGGALGGRRFDSCFVAFALGLAIAFEAIRGSQSAPRPRVRYALLAAGALWCTILGIANIRVVASQSAPYVRTYGGEAVHEIFAEEPWPLGMVSSLTSNLSNLPVRAWFAWQHEQDLGAYDRLVGVHALGELYPGLNSTTEPPAQLLRLAPEHGARGLERRAESWHCPSGEFSLLVGLNRRGPIRFTLVGLGLSQAPEFFFGDTALEVQRDEYGNYWADALRYQRGTNTLRVRSPQPFDLRGLQISTEVDATGRSALPQAQGSEPVPVFKESASAPRNPSDL